MHLLNKFSSKVFMCALVALCFLGTKASVHAQNRFDNSFNFESSSLPYNWHATAWSQCLGECNNGVQDRDVFCRDNSGNNDPSEDNCSHTPKPEEDRICELPDCQWVPPPSTCAPHEHWNVEVAAEDSGNFRGIDAEGNHVCNGPDC